MPVLNFNSLSYASKLKEAGMPEELANTQAEELSNIINTHLVTKTDLELLKNELIIKLGTLVISSTGILAVLIGIFGFLGRHA